MVPDMNTAVQIAGHLAWLLAWLGFSWFTGTTVLTVLGRMDGRNALQVPNVELKVFLGTCSGIAMQIPVVIALALAGALSPGYIAATAVLILAGAILLTRKLQNYWPVTELGRVNNAALWFDLLPLFLLIAAWVIRPLGPLTSHDDISYHLPYARFYLNHGGLAVNEYLRFPLHTHNYNLLFSVALLRDGTTMAQWVHAVSGFLVMLGTWGLARHWFGWLAAVTATALLLFLEVFRQALGNAYVDLGLTLFFTASVVALVMWTQYRRNAWLWLSAAFMGTMLGIKYLALVLAGLIGLLVIWLTRNLRQVLIYAGIAALFGCFWYVRSMLISGNPVHPFASEIFGHYIWTADDVNLQLRELGRHGTEKTPLNFILLPWHLVMNAGVFLEKAGLVGWLVGLFFLSLLMFRRWPRMLRPLSLVGLAYLVFWFGSSQVMRYMMPVTPLMALSVASLSFILLQVIQKYVLRRNDTEEVTGLAMVNRVGQLMVIIPVAIVSWNILDTDLKRLPLSDEGKVRFFTSSKAGYELYQVAGAHAAIDNGPLLQIGNESHAYFYDGTLYGDWFGHYPYRNFFEGKENGQYGLKRPQYFWELLRAEGIRGMVFSKKGGEEFYPQDMKEFYPWFEIVFSNQFGDILVPRPDAPVNPE